MAKARRRTSRRATRSSDLPVKKTKASRVKGGDEVLVAFQQGDLRAPYVVGTLWSGSDQPPTTSSTPPSRAPLRKA